MNTKKGFTLVELLVTVGLFTIIITIAVGGFTSAVHTQRQVSSLISAQSNVSLALEQIARQIRTGYLFCHSAANTGAGSGSPGSSVGQANADCGCVYSSVADSSGQRWWTCKALDFYDAGSNHVEYYRSIDGELMASSSEGNFSITGNTVTVKYLNFQLHGQVENDQWNPRITISLGIAPSSTDPGVSGDTFNLETTISARNIDCATVGGATSC